MLVTMFFVSIVGFVIINLPPGSYLDVYREPLEAQGTTTTASQLETIVNQYGLDQPIYVQYWKWVSGFVQGDFGRSFAYNKDVSELIWERLILTMVISITTLIVTWLIAIPIGIYSATHQYQASDHFFTTVGMVGLSIPNFLLALIFMVIAAMVFDQSVGGLFSPEYQDAPWNFAKLWDLLKHMWIPVLVVGTSGTAGLIRMMRGNLLDVLKIAYITSARAKRMVESGEDVMILLDSVTRLVRAYNLVQPSSGRTLSGGIEPQALYPPKGFFGAARNIDGGGSLTIIASCLIETGSRMDEVIYEEFKGTGNWELMLDRRLAERGTFPAVNVLSSGTRRVELMLDAEGLKYFWTLRRMLNALDPHDAYDSTELMFDRMKRTATNKEFFASLSDSSR